MKSKEEIEQLLKTEIEKNNLNSKLFIAAIERNDKQSIHNLFIESVKITGRIVAFKEVLNHD